MFTNHKCESTKIPPKRKKRIRMDRRWVSLEPFGGNMGKKCPLIEHELDFILLVNWLYVFTFPYLLKNLLQNPGKKGDLKFFLPGRKPIKVLRKGYSAKNFKYPGVLMLAIARRRICLVSANAKCAVGNMRIPLNQCITKSQFQNAARVEEAMCSTMGFFYAER